MPWPLGGVAGGGVVGRRLCSKTDQGPLVGDGGGAVVCSLRHRMGGLEGTGWYQVVSVLSPEGWGWFETEL